MYTAYNPGLTLGRRLNLRRNALWILSAAIVLVCTNAGAALRYEFRENLIMENSLDSKNMTARAVLDGEKGRIDVLSGNQYAPGSYILRDGKLRLFFVFPDRKQYNEGPIKKGPNKEQANKVSITNPQIAFEELPDGGVIAGYPTRHYRLTTSYEMSMTFGKVVVRQKVEATIDKWTTTAFDDFIAQYQDDSELATGNSEVDMLLQTEASKFKGLPLKMRSVVKTTPEQHMQGSKLNLPATRQRVREMEVSKIEQVTVSPDLFTIPLGFKPSTDMAPAASAHYLTMEPTKE
jgi:hypothetical protein